MKSYANYLCGNTDDTLREIAHHGNDSYPFAYYPEDIWEFDFHCVDWHWHHELEFLSVTEGTALCLVGEDRIELSQGYGLFINSSILHRLEAADKAYIHDIVFAPDLLAGEETLLYEKYIRPVIRSDAAYQILAPHVEWQEDILQILEATYALQRMDSSRKELRTVHLLLQAWDIMSEHMDLSYVQSKAHRLNHKQARLQIMMQYIHDHYRDELTLEEIAASASVSKSAALQTFQSGIRVSPVSYLIQYRLSRAAELLYTTEKPVSTIAAETGFTSAGYFCRKFKERYQMSPIEYRRNKV